MPSRAYTSFLLDENKSGYPIQLKCVNALSGLYLISTKKSNPEGVYND